MFGNEVEAVAQGAKEAARMTHGVDLGGCADTRLFEDRSVVGGCALAVSSKVAIFAPHVGSLSQDLIQGLIDSVPWTGLSKVTNASKGINLSSRIAGIRRARNFGGHNDGRTRSLSQLLEGWGGRELCSQGRLFIALSDDEDHDGIESNVQLGRDHSAIAKWRCSVTYSATREADPPYKHL